MTQIRAIQKWRALTAVEQRQRRLAAIPRKVARSMAFEGEPVTEDWVAAQRQRLAMQRDTSKPVAGS